MFGKIYTDMVGILCPIVSRKILDTVGIACPMMGIIVRVKIFGTLYCLILSDIIFQVEGPTRGWSSSSLLSRPGLYLLALCCPHHDDHPHPLHMKSLR